MHVRPLLAASAFLPIFVLAAPRAQDLTPAPADVLRAAHLRAGTIQSLRLPPATDRAVTLRVRLGPAQYALELIPRDLRSADFRLLVDDGRGPRQVPTPASTTFRGHVAGRPGSAVAASLEGAAVWAHVRVDGETWGIQPLAATVAGAPAELHLVYRRADTRWPAGVRCGQGPEHVREPAAGGGPSSVCTTKIAELAIDCDLEWFRHNGSSVTATQNAATRVVNAADLIYQTDLRIEYSITTILVRTARTYSNTDMRQLLPEFRNRWNSQHGNVRRDVAHLFTGKGGFSGIVGIAYLAVICSNSAYGVDKLFSGQFGVDVGLLAHELGHNWAAPHCDSAAPCNIMCSGLGGCTGNLAAFAPASIAPITAHRDSRSCLTTSAPKQPPALQKLLPASAPAFPNPVVTVTGQNLIFAERLLVGSTPVGFDRPAPDQIRFRLPSGLGIGQHPVQVTGCAGNSNSLTLDITGTHPSVLQSPEVVVRYFGYPFRLYTDRSWRALLLVSGSNQPSVLPGWVSLGIGSGFANLAQVAVMDADATGFTERWIQIPAALKRGTELYWQAVTFDPRNFTRPLEVSNVNKMLIGL